MSRGRVWIGFVVLTLALSACGGGDDEAKDSKGASNSSSSASSSPTVTPSPSPTPPPQVSVKTTCDLIFDTDQGKTPFDTVLDFIMRDTNSQQQADKAQEAIDELREIASSAEPNLGAQMNAFADEAQEILDDAYLDDPPVADTTALRAAGLEVANTCQGYY